mgnify:CR=1 FL=1
MKGPSFREAIAGVLSVAAVGALIYLAVTGQQEATGAVVAVSSGAVVYFLRGKVETQ